MFRVRLAIVILFLFGFVLFLGLTLYWGSNQIDRYFQRSQAAYESFDIYERLSQEAYRHFKQRMDHLITDNQISQNGVELSKRRLYEAMEELRTNAVKAPNGWSDDEDWGHKPAELERVAHFTAFLDSSAYRFDEVEQFRQQGNRDQAIRALSQFSEQEIDGRFQPLIDAAIKIEREKARLAKIKMESLVDQQRWIAMFASIGAAIFSLLSGLLLLKSVKRPIEALMKGTKEIANGNLSYRIPVKSRDEFAFLASHFNTMADKLGQQQAKLRESRSVLESRVAERTAELNSLNEELNRMDSERRAFLADISHELRTPITIIRGEAEVTLRDDQRDPEEYKDALQRIIELSVQLGKYVNDLIFLARADTANLQFDWDKLDLKELVVSTIEDFQVMAAEKTIQVSLKVPDQPVWVLGDRQRLKQVLFILGDNACRYSQQGKRIEVSLNINDREASFSLQDQGIGIPADDLKHIFDRHFRSKNALNISEDGSGLGLPLAKSIVEAHDGRITVKSIENTGSKFTVSLPLSV